MDWSYIAGFFDGEGNFHTRLNRKKQSYQLLIRMYGCNKELLKEIQKFLGYGSIYTKRKDSENRSACYELTISNKKHTKDFLLKIKDLLIEKKSQAEFLLNNFVFEYNSNKNFDIDMLRSFITRKNISKFRKNHTIKPLTE